MSDKELPAGWAWIRLEDAAEVSGGIQKQQKRQPTNNIFPFLRVANVGRGSLDLDDVHEVELFDGELDRYRLKAGDLLVVEGNGSPEQIGRAAIWDGSIPDAVHQNHLIRVRTTSAISSRYLEFAWNAPLVAEQLRRVAQSTSGLYTLSTAKLKAIQIPIAPLAEQRRIVEALENHLSRLDVAQAYTTRSQARLTRLSGAFRDLLIIGGNSTLPDGWHWGTLGEVLDRVEAGKSFKCEPRPAASDEWGVIKVSAMTWGTFKETEQKAVPAGKGFDPRHEIQDGDILVSRANTSAYVGAPVLVRRPRPKLLLSDKSLRLVPTAGIDKAWLLHVLASPYVRSQISDRATGTKDSMRNISQRDLVSVRIPIPPRLAQSDVVEAIEAQLSATDQLSSSLAHATSRSGHLRKSLLARAFTGKLIPQDPADEPASELLARIRAERAAQPKPTRTRRTPTPRRVKANTTAATEAPPAPDRTTPLPPTAVQQEFEL